MGLDINNVVERAQSQVPIQNQNNQSQSQDNSLQDFQRTLPSVQVPQGNNRPFGKSGQSFTYSPTSGQQSMGSPNPYPNTVGMGDNQGNQPMPQAGKGKGA